MHLDDDQEQFAALARRSGVPLTQEEIVALYEGYRLLRQTVGDLERPTDPMTEPALIFQPMHPQCR